MANGNAVTVMGNITRDPEIRYTPNGQANATFGVAVNRRWQNRQTNEWEERTSFFNIVCWRELAEQRERVARQGRTGHRDRPPRAAFLGNRPGRQAQRRRDRCRRGRPELAVGERPDHEERPQGRRRLWRRRRWRRRRGKAEEVVAGGQRPPPPTTTSSAKSRSRHPIFASDES